MLDFILLGMLRKNASGYDLKARFARSAAHYWSADQSQIYRTLKRMEGAGWLKSRVEPSPEGPDRRVYRRTPAGSDALKVWLREEPHPPVTRLPFVGQLFFMGELDDLSATLSFLETVRDQMRRRVAALEFIELNLEDEHDFHASLSLDLGLAVAQARLDWCTRALGRVRRRIAKTNESKNSTSPGASR